MAQRYGRRRRRAAREKIEAQDKEIWELIRRVDSAQLSASKAEGRLERFKAMMSDWDADVRMMFGTHSAFLFNMSEMSVRFDDPRDVRRLPLPERLRASAMLGECPDDAIAMRVAYLLHCCYEVSSQEDALRKIVTYIRLRISNHADSIYAFSEDYWRNFGPRSERDVHHLAENIAKTMLANVKPLYEPKK